MSLLSDLKVVEWSTWVAGPGCAGVMADWGASVIKVESAAGDATRAFFPDTAESPGNPVFTMENRGKRGVVLDTAKPEGRAALVALLKQADVFITNVRPGSLARARLDFDSLKAELPQLIYANVTGYGLTGEMADTAAFDITAFWTRSGVAHAFIPPDQEPFASRPGFGDHFTALATLSGILAAVHERTRTGRGRQVETALMRVGAYAVGWDLSLQLRYGDVTTAQPKKDRMVALSGFFHTADDRWLCIVVKSPADYPNVMRAFGRGDILAEPRYLPPYADIEDVRHVRAILEAGFEALTLEEAGDLLNTADVAWAPMDTLQDLEMNPQAHEAGCFVDTPDGWGGSFFGPASPVRFPGLDTSPRGPAPKLGQHTREVLAEAGYAADEVEALIAAGVAL
ncbi:CaiB/BaiF CoA-transferase family protein [Phenylobacterium sp.]|uniref:CaiB/BaiF CoA transferase family protein n=1 Tax=Phenylobacterium sp. TaxID=1871053 RepID=UPI002BB5B002|nr:CaiB/BaiF CoA-transferase family protein [Phenylobacterium sp.]HLZ75368.1 CaiB/BaiF CoA-transferase family protein [Phenylobacterium sp.]